MKNGRRQQELQQVHVVDQLAMVVQLWHKHLKSLLSRATALAITGSVPRIVFASLWGERGGNVWGSHWYRLVHLPSM
jgi:hypothetical protein